MASVKTNFTIFLKITNKHSNKTVMEIITPASISTTLPPECKPNIIRENLISTIYDMLNSETEVIIIEGVQGIGKTTLLSQFTRQFEKTTLSIFIKSSSRFAYDSENLTKDLCDQIQAILPASHAGLNRQTPPSQLLRELSFELTRHANRNNKTYYFIIDGLLSIPEADVRERNAIMECLPFGSTRFKFIITGPSDELKSAFKSLPKSQSLRVIGFTTEESKEYLRDIIKDDNTLGVFHSMAKMNPGNLATIRRLITGGRKPEEIINQSPENPPDWFKLEWDSINKDDDFVLEILSILAFDKRQHSRESLAKLCGTSIDNIDHAIKNTPSISYSEKGVNYTCEVFRKFSESKLTYKKKETLDKIISKLLEEPESNETLSNLPSILNQAERHEELLSYLSPEHIGKLIDHGESWAPLHQKTSLGVNTAFNLERDTDLLRFSIQSSLIETLENAEPWRSEVEAHVALDNYEAAQKLVQHIATKEDRLHLLCVIAKSKKQKKSSIEPELIEQIKGLVKSINKATLGTRGIEIASELLFILPESAIELVQESSGGDLQADRVDMAFARLSLNALLNKDSANDQNETTRKQIRDKVKNPAIHKFMDTAALFFGGYTASGVILEVDKWEKPADKIFALKEWTMINRSKNDSIEVTKHAIAIILKTTEFTPDAKIYKELLAPIEHSTDVESIKHVIDRIDALKGAIESIGPTTEYVSLISLISIAEFKINKSHASNRLNELLEYINTITDKAAKLASYAILAMTIKKIEKTNDKLLLDEKVLQHLSTAIDEMLQSTADHYIAIKPALMPLSIFDSELALSTIDKINTKPRREDALLSLIEAIASTQPIAQSSRDIQRAYNKIDSVVNKAKATRRALKKFFKERKTIKQSIGEILFLKNWIKEIPNPEERCTAYFSLIDILIENKEYVNDLVLSKTMEDLNDSWNSIHSEWEKIDVGFTYATRIATYSKEKSALILNKTQEIKNDTIFDSNNVAASYIGCIRFCIRAFGGLIKLKSSTEDDRDAVLALIDAIPCHASRIHLYTELSFKFAKNDNLNELNHIVTRKIKPLIDSIGETNENTKWHAIMSSAPVLFTYHKASTLQMISTLPYPYRDSAYHEICTYVLQRKISTELYDNNHTSKIPLSYEEVLDCIDVLNCIEEDSMIYMHIESIAEAIKDKKSKINNAQVADVCKKLEDLIDKKLPSPGFIKHNGYKIISLAKLHASLGRKDFLKESKLLEDQADAILNIADKSFILATIASTYRPKDGANAIALLQRAKALCINIPLMEDRVHRFEYIAKTAIDFDAKLAKECLTLAWTNLSPVNNDSFNETRRNLIDFAHRLDPDLASTLASNSSEDHGRDLAKQEIKERVELLKLREKSNVEPLDVNSFLGDDKKLVEISTMMLSGLNSDRVQPIAFHKIRSLIVSSSKLHLSESDVVLSWIIENAISKYGNNKENSPKVRQLFESTKLSIELALKLAERIKSSNRSMTSTVGTKKGAQLIKPGERDSAIMKIESWITDAKDFIKITDPYFSLDDLEFVKTIRRANSSIPIIILTSKRNLMEKVTPPWDEAFQNHWRICLSDEDPGDVTFLVMGKGTHGDHPIHDRWWLSSSNGLRLGTSLNSYGTSRISEISSLSKPEVDEFLIEVDKLINARPYTLKDEKITKTTFSL